MENYGKIIHRTWDNSYVINDGTYHVPNNEEFKSQWEQVHEYALANPNMVTEEYPYTPSLDELKKAKLAEVDAWTANKITGGFVSTCYNGENILYDTDVDTQITMQFAKNCCDSDRFAEELPDGLEVRGYEQVDVDEDGTLVFSKDKTIYYFSPEQIKTWNENFALFLRECKKEGWMKQAEVNACTTKEELAKVDLNW